MERRLIFILLIASTSWSAQILYRCMPINAPGTYSLPDDIVLAGARGPCFFINSSGVTLDLGGHSISCGTNQSIFSFSEGLPSASLSLANGRIVGCQIGAAFPCPFERIENLSISNSSCVCGTEITHSNFSDSRLSICNGFQAGGTISGNEFHNNARSIDFNCASGFQVSGNTFAGSTESALHVYHGKTCPSANVTITGNRFINNARDCVEERWVDAAFLGPGYEPCNGMWLNNFTDPVCSNAFLLLFLCLAAFSAALRANQT